MQVMLVSQFGTSVDARPNELLQNACLASVPFHATLLPWNTVWDGADVAHAINQAISKIKNFQSRNVTDQYRTLFGATIALPACALAR